MKALINVLNSAGKPTKVLQTQDGSRVLVLPYGGRVLGLFSPGSDENFYWTHDALRSAETASAFYAGDQWHNSGGDRTWLAPEADLFFPNFPKLDKYFQQRSLDPGKYEVVATATGFKLVNRLIVQLSRLKEDVELEITKSFGPALNPLRHERGLALSGVEYAGYTQETSLALLGSSRGTTGRVGLWNLVQMPHGGELLIPTYGRTEPRLIMGKIPPEDLRVTEQLIAYRMRQAGEHKIGIRAVATAGRVGYVYQSGEQRVLIVRNFVVNPSGEYVDVPWDDPADFGYSTQACNVNSGLGKFSELEYHLPAIGHGTGRTRCDDEAQVWAFRGPQAAIAQVLKALLTSDTSVRSLWPSSATK